MAGLSKPENSGRRVGGAVQARSGIWSPAKAPQPTTNNTSPTALNKAREDALPKPWTVLFGRNDIR